jgi:hypothetical protein
MASQRKSFAADLIRNLAVIFLLAGLVWYLARDFAEKGKGTDFPDFYAAARMVRAGMGKQLYDPAMQSAYQARYVGRSGSLYLHPPFEVLVYLPFSWAPLPLAYGLWNLFSAALLIACARLLRPLANRNWSWQLVLGCSVGFTPVLLCFLQGQDSILLLLILLLTLRALSRGQDVVAGLLLACGLFKFHLALPLFVIFAIARKGKFIVGFASSALLLVLVSIGIAGWASLLSYPRFLIHFSEFPMPGNSPLGMANLHGLVDGLAPLSGHLGSWLIAGGSLLVLGLALRGISGAAQEQTALSFGIAVIAAILVSYHLSPHDLVLLLIPLATVIGLLMGNHTQAKWWRTSAIVIIAMLFLPPLYVLLLRNHLFFLLTLPIIGLVLLLSRASARTAFPKAA